MRPTPMAMGWSILKSSSQRSDRSAPIANCSRSSAVPSPRHLDMHLWMEPAAPILSSQRLLALLKPPKCDHSYLGRPPRRYSRRAGQACTQKPGLCNFSWSYGLNLEAPRCIQAVRLILGLTAPLVIVHSSVTWAEQLQVSLQRRASRQIRRAWT